MSVQTVKSFHNTKVVLEARRLCERITGQSYDVISEYYRLGKLVNASGLSLRDLAKQINVRGFGYRTLGYASQFVSAVPPNSLDKFLSGLPVPPTWRSIIEKMDELAQQKRVEEVIREGLGKNVKSTLFNSRFQDADIPDNSVDVIITDPPYPKAFLPLYSELAVFAKRVLKPNGSLVALSGNLYIEECLRRFSEHLEYRWIVCFGSLNRPGSVQINTAIIQKQMWKPVLVYSKPPLKRLSITYDFVESPAPEKSLYEWQQSVPPFEELVRLFSKEGDTVCDPMMGVGTTGIAAVRNKRRFIGIEMDKERFKISKARIVKEEEEKW
jgi:hypothetical protein